jgi:hypothetical protein
LILYLIAGVMHDKHVWIPPIRIHPYSSEKEN